MRETAFSLFFLYLFSTLPSHSLIYIQYSLGFSVFYLFTILPSLPQYEGFSIFFFLFSFFKLNISDIINHTVCFFFFYHFFNTSSRSLSQSLFYIHKTYFYLFYYLFYNSHNILVFIFTYNSLK